MTFKKYVSPSTLSLNHSILEMKKKDLLGFMRNKKKPIGMNTQITMMSPNFCESEDNKIFSHEKSQLPSGFNFGQKTPNVKNGRNSLETFQKEYLFNNKYKVLSTQGLKDKTFDEKLAIVLEKSHASANFKKKAHKPKIVDGYSWLDNMVTNKPPQIKNNNSFERHPFFFTPVDTQEFN
jgi:DNA segregation ATPase FtsK/SpoIIIE-like protein